MWRRIVSSHLRTLAADVATASSRRSIATTARPVGFYPTANRSAISAYCSVVPHHFSSESVETIAKKKVEDVMPIATGHEKEELEAELEEYEPIIKVAQDATEIKQGNPLPLLLSDLDSTPHISDKMTICTTEDTEDDSMRLEGNQFALLDQSETFKESSSRTSRGGRPIKPTQKVQEMLWTIAGGRGNRGRRGRGG